MSSKPKTRSPGASRKLTNMPPDVMRKLAAHLSMRNVSRVAATSKNLRTVAKPLANASRKRATAVVSKAFYSPQKFVAKLRPLLATLKAGLETRIRGALAGLTLEDLDEATAERMETRVSGGAQVDFVEDSVYVSTDDGDVQIELTLDPIAAANRAHSFACILTVIGKGGRLAEKAVVDFTPRWNSVDGTWSVTTRTPKTSTLARGTWNAAPSPFGYTVAGSLRLATDDVFGRGKVVENLRKQAMRVNENRRLALKKRPAPSARSRSATKKTASPTAARKRRRVALPPLKLWNTFPIGSFGKRRS